MDSLNFTETRVSDRVTVLTLGQVVDNNNAEAVVQTIVAAQRQGCYSIVVDCAGLEFMSSAGVGAILGTIDTSRSRGGDIVLCAVSEPVMHIFGVLDLLDFLTIRPTRDEALALVGISAPAQ